MFSCSLRRVRPLLSGLAVAALMSACGGDDDDGSGRFREVVSFGDSLSDVGTYNVTTAMDRVTPSAVGQRFTTKPGPVWAEVVASGVGAALHVNEQVDFGVLGAGGRIVALGGTSYAQGGARITQNGEGRSQVIAPDGSTVTVQGPTEVSITTQIDRYLAAYSHFDARQLVLIQGGANDFLPVLRDVARGEVAPGPALMAEAQQRGTEMAAQVKRLTAAGARYVVYANLPDLGNTPLLRGSPLAAVASGLSATYNQSVAAALADTDVVIFDLAALLANVMASPASFGLSNVEGAACTSINPATGETSALLCTPQTLVNAQADQQYLYADVVHPTTAGHAVWGARVLTLVNARF